ncbi:MAG: hypothetical protein Q8O64_10375 [Sideroxyarcus sp.]|nr:hypothetical protein [Sideroxyarcus sp.]
MNKIHVIILNYEPQFSDGRVVRVKALVRYLALKGKDVYLYSFSNVSQTTKKDGFTHVEVKYPGMGMLMSDRPVGRESNVMKRMVLAISRVIYPDRYLFGIPLIHGRLQKNVSRGDALILSCPWFSVLLLALYPIVLRKKLKLILDYRDLWVNNPIFARGSVQRLIASWLEGVVLKRSCAVSVTTTSAAKYFEVKGARTILVSNGINLSDFSKISSINCQLSEDSHRLKLGYFGNIGNKRDCKDLLQNIIDAKIELSLYGNLDLAHLVVCGQSYHGKLDRDESLLRASECSFLLIVIRKNENSDFAIPGKVYECILLRKPILLYCPSDALVLTYLVELSYPHFHVESEKNVDLHSCIQQFVIFSKSLDYSSLNKHYEVPIREHEFSKLDQLFGESLTS